MKSSTKKVVVTGAAGLLGWHLRVALSLTTDWTIEGLDREAFHDDSVLATAIEDADVIVHLAGMNRGDDSAVAKTNENLAKRLAEALERTSSPKFVVYSSSTHADKNSAYGKSKKLAGEILEQAVKLNGGSTAIIVFPHLFGEQGKPFYNSVVSTFCHQISTGEPISVNGDGGLELLHCQDASDIIRNTIQRRDSGEIRPAGRRIKVSELAEKLKSMAKSYYHDLTIPSLDEQIDVQLFNTLRSFSPTKAEKTNLKLHSDDRGWLFEAVREQCGGQVFMSSTKPGITRGNHSHRHKVERFLVLRGKADISMRRLLTDETVTVSVDGESPAFVDIPTLWTHNIKNVGEEELLTLFWVNEIFDPETPDTYFESV